MSRFTPVVDSYLRCIEDESFFVRFYEVFLESDPFIKKMFADVDFENQRNLIRRGMMSILTYLNEDSVAGKVTLRRLKGTHGPEGMNIQLTHYNIWRDTMLQTVKAVDTEMDDDLANLWREALDRGIMLMMSNAPVEAVEA